MVGAFISQVERRNTKDAETHNVHILPDRRPQRIWIGAWVNDDAQSLLIPAVTRRAGCQRTETSRGAQIMSMNLQPCLYSPVGK